MKNNITVLLTTCDRYDTTLPLCLLSIINQTRKPDRIVIVDDSIQNKFYESYQIKQLLIIAKYKNLTIDYYHGERKGAVPALQKGFEKIKDGWILKTDDDNVLEPNVLEIYESHISDEIGGMGGIVLMDDKVYTRSESNAPVSSKIEDLYTHFNIQMVYNQSDEPKEVDHLYSNYFFRKEAIDSFPLEIQPSSYREETILTYSIKRKNYKLFVYPQSKTYHLRTSNGNKKWGNSNDAKNERTLISKLKEWDVIPNKISIFEDNERIYTKRNNTNYLILDKRNEKV